MSELKKLVSSARQLSSDALTAAEAPYRKSIIAARAALERAETDRQSADTRYLQAKETHGRVYGAYERLKTADLKTALDAAKTELAEASEATDSAAESVRQRGHELGQANAPLYVFHALSTELQDFERLNLDHSHTTSDFWRVGPLLSRAQEALSTAVSRNRKASSAKKRVERWEARHSELRSQLTAAELALTELDGDPNRPSRGAIATARKALRRKAVRLRSRLTTTAGELTEANSRYSKTLAAVSIFVNLHNAVRALYDACMVEQSRRIAASPQVEESNWQPETSESNEGGCECNPYTEGRCWHCILAQNHGTMLQREHNPWD